MYEIKLGIQAFLRNRKRTLTTLGLITLLITFVVFINTILYTNNATRDLERELWFGAWSHAFTDESKSQSFKTVGTYYKITDTVGSFDNTMLDLSNFEYYNGRAPKNENEVIVTLDAINTLGISYDLNQNITIDNYQFKVVGIIFPYNADWVRIVDIDYPTIITTNMTASNVVYFGIANKLNPFYNIDDFVAVNTYAYPYLDLQGEMYRQRTDEEIERHIQSLKLTQFMLIAMIVVLAVVFKNNAQFYRKRFEVLTQQGITKWGILRYFLPQLIIYALVVPLLFYSIPIFFELALMPFRQIRFDINMKHLLYSSERVVSMVVILYIFSLISEKFKLQQTLKLGIVQIMLVLVVSFSTVYIATPQTINLHDERIPLWKTAQIAWDWSMHYIANGSLGGHSNEPNLYSSYDREWVIEDFDILKNHPKTEYVLYWNIRYVQHVDEYNEMANPAIIYYDDGILRGFELPINISDDFIKGNSFYYYGDILQSSLTTIEEGDVVYFEDIPFTYELNFNLDESSTSEILLNFGILISEAGAKRLGLPTDKYNIFKVGVEEMSNFIDYDILVRRVAGRSFFTNRRLLVERAINREKSITIFMAFEILIQYGLGLAILALLCLQKLMTKRKTLAIYHFLGDSKTKMILKHSTLFVIPALIVILPSILVAVNMKILPSSLMFSLIIGAAFVLVLWIVCLLIHITYLKGSLFELLDERE